MESHHSTFYCKSVTRIEQPPDPLTSAGYIQYSKLEHNISAASAASATASAAVSRACRPCRPYELPALMQTTRLHLLDHLRKEQIVIIKSNISSNTRNIQLKKYSKEIWKTASLVIDSRIQIRTVPQDVFHYGAPTLWHRQTFSRSSIKGNVYN